MPTIEEVYRSSNFFIKKYEEAGVENACAKIRHLIYLYLEQKRIEAAIAQSLKESNRTGRRLTRIPDVKKTTRKSRKRMIKSSKLSGAKKLAKLRVVRSRYKMNLDALPDLNKKLEKYPVITYRPDEVTFDTSAKIMVKHFRKQFRHRPSH